MRSDPKGVGQDPEHPHMATQISVVIIPDVAPDTHSSSYNQGYIGVLYMSCCRLAVAGHREATLLEAWISCVLEGLPFIRSCSNFSITRKSLPILELALCLCRKG